MRHRLGAALLAAAVVVPLAFGAAAHAAPSGVHTPAPGGVGVGDPIYPTLGNSGYDVRHYDIGFRYDPSTQDFTARTVIEARATQALSSFSLDFDGHTVDRVTVNGAAAQVSRDGRKLFVTPASSVAYRHPFRTVVTYHGNIHDRLVGLQGWVYPSDGGFATAAQASRAEDIYPCNDHPIDKATFTFRLTAPDGWTAAANGSQVGSVSANGQTTSTFVLRYPMATELTGMSVTRSTLVTGTGPHGIRLRSYVPAGQEAKYGPIVNSSGAQIAWLEDQLGVRYPYDTYGLQIVVSGYGDALENQTLSLFGPNWFTGTSYPNTMVHELAHQWFGDSVTPTMWRDAWLNEGPAMFFQYRYAAQHGGTPVEDVMRGIYAKDGGWRTSLGPPGATNGLGGSNIYDGAALVLYALQSKVGPTTTKRILADWLRANRQGNGTTEGFVELATRVSHDSTVDGFLRHWLFDPTTPPMPGHPDWT
jgi:aminopeptidase N